jgi:molybdopterin synthase sulfur carrier subunit
VPEVTFTRTLLRHLPAPPASVGGATVGEALDAVFRDNPRLRGYVLDDQGRLRRHVAVFVDGEQIVDRERLSDPVRPEGKVHVLQALSGG